MNGSMRLCRYCGGPLPDGSTRHRLYCSDHCRRKYQDERRKAERDELKALRHEDKAGDAWLDPWSRCDVDDWTAEEILANALLDPLPAGLVWEDSSIKLKFGNRPSSGRDGLGWDDTGNHEGTRRSDKDGEVTARSAKRKARRESRKKRRRTARLLQGFGR